MKEIQAEGTRYMYFTENEEFPTEVALGLKIDNSLAHLFWENVIHKNMEDIRLVLIRGFNKPEEEARVCFLHWNDKSDLALLDEKVRENVYTDADFRSSIKTELRKTICFVCNWSGDTLVVPTGDPYIGAPGLEESKLKLRVATGGFKKCPSCGSDLRQGVVKIFSTNNILT